LMWPAAISRAMVTDSSPVPYENVFMLEAIVFQNQK
jgi:hypothetical protein